MHCWLPPKPENIYQNDCKSNLTSDDFSHVSSINVTKSCIFRARNDLGNLLGQRSQPTKEKIGWPRARGRVRGNELKRVIKGHLLLVTDGARTQPHLLTSYERIFPLPPVSFQITKTLTRPCQQPTNRVNICYNKIPAVPRDFEMCIHVV